VVTTVWGVTTSTQSGPHNNFPVSGGTVAAGGVGPGGGGYAQQGAPNKQGTPFTGTGYRQGVPPGWVLSSSWNSKTCYNERLKKSPLGSHSWRIWDFYMCEVSCFVC
jgi:hypothetical protein